MAISFIGRTSGGAINAGAITLTLPGGMQARDLILVMHCDGDTTDNAMPTPTTADYTDVGTSEQYSNGSSNDSNSRAWYKFHNGTDTTCVVAATPGGSNSGSSAALMVFRGVATHDQGGPFCVPVTKATGTTANANNPSIVTAPGCAVVLMASAAQATAGTFTAPTNYTTNAELGTGGTDTIDGKAAMAYRLSGYAGREDAAAWAVSGSVAGDAWTAVTLVLKEADFNDPNSAFPFPEWDPTQEVYPFSFQNTAETGLADNTTVTTGNSGGTAGTPWSTVTIAAGTLVYDTGAVHRGTLSYESAHVAVDGLNTFAWNDPLLGFNSEQYYRAYFRWASAPSTTPYFINWYHATTFLCGMTIGTTGLIRSVDQNGANIHVSSGTYADGGWYRIEVHLVQSTQTFEWRIFSGHSTTALETFSSSSQDLGADTFGSFRLGSAHNTGVFTHSLNIDDIAITTEDWIGPSAVAPTVAPQFMLVNTALGAA